MNLAPFHDHKESLASGESIEAVALAALEAAKAAEGCFVSLCTEEDVRASSADVARRLAAGEDLPLAGIPFCVKDNLDVRGMASTSNCPGYGRIADASAPAVQKALDAGAVLIGKNTMDQFATGLNGTRSPEPLCRNAVDPSVIPGGSSSGSAVAVALGICGFALGSDTGGSGRVPAAANGIVGLKPTPGLVSGRGMVYCNRSFDVIPIFAKTVDEASSVLSAIAGPDPLDPFAYRGPVTSGTLSRTPVLAVPSRLEHFGDAAAAAAHEANLAVLREAGFELTELDFAPFAEAGKLVFESAMVAERLVDYGDFIADYPELVLKPVARAIDAGRGYSARDAFQAMYRLAELRLAAEAALAGADAMVVPTIPRLFTVEEMQADPMARNTIMGTYTYFANPLGLSAIAVPGVRRGDGLPSSICFVGRGGADDLVVDLAKRFEVRAGA